jgi:DNA-directed RNA polymerase sigma subunit (sigma70/sigma32)
VAVFGIGGVGGYTVEALARGGIGSIDVIDSDTVGLSNLNRQLLATHSTLGMLKVEAARQRILDMLSTLTEQEAKVLTLRFGLEGGLPQTPQQAGQTLGLTADEVVNLEAAALTKLRQQEQ